MHWIMRESSWRHVQFYHVVQDDPSLTLLLVDPVTREPADPCLRSLTSLATVEIHHMDDDVDRNSADIHTLRAVLDTWTPNSLSRRLGVTMSVTPWQRTRKGFLDFISQIGRVVEEHCSGSSTLCHIALS